MSLQTCQPFHPAIKQYAARWEEIFAEFLLTQMPCLYFSSCLDWLVIIVYMLQDLTISTFLFCFFFMCLFWCAALVLPKAEQLLRTSIQPYISSILEALMEPTSRGFSEVREVFFRELVEISKNSLNGGGKEKLGDVSHLSAGWESFCLYMNYCSSGLEGSGTTTPATSLYNVTVRTKHFSICGLSQGHHRRYNPF